MIPRFSCFFLRVAAFALAVAFVACDAAAQGGYDPRNDPLVQMRINHGEEMRSPFNQDRDLGMRYSTSGGSFIAQIAYIPFRPPALGSEFNNSEGVAGPAGAADDTREPFYGALAVLLYRDEVPAKVTERLVHYRSIREKLLREIQSTFEKMGNVSPGDRRKILTSLATDQERELRALAAEAEGIRQDLAWVGSYYGLGSNLPPAKGFYSKDSVRQPFRYVEAAYYFAGLSTEQRLLLPEIAYERQIASRNEPDVRVDGREYFDFFPATARIILPPDLPPSLKEKILTFSNEKTNLKDELARAVLRDDYFFARTRTQRLAALAEQQAPRFATLEALAEEIRLGLAEIGYPKQPAPSNLPADLTGRVGDFQVRKAEVQRELLAQLRRLKKESPATHFDIAREGDGLVIVQTSNGAKPVAGLAEFNARLASRYTAFARESENLRRDIQAYTDASPVRRTVRELAEDFAKDYATRESWNQYRDYARAVLEPGLSPAQRHVLFQSALADLVRGNRVPKS